MVARLQLDEQRGDARTGVGQVGDETVDVVDQPFLVGDEPRDVAVGEVDRAAQRRHERLRVVGERGEPLGQRQQEQMHPGRVGVPLAGQDGQRLQLLGDVPQRHRLQRATPPDRLLVERDRLLGGLPGRGELEQEALAVEVLHGGDPAGVGVGPQIAPLPQLLQRLPERVVALAPQLRRHVLGPQMHDEPFLRPGENPQNLAIEGGVGRAQVRERLMLLRRKGHTSSLPDQSTCRVQTPRAKPRRNIGGPVRGRMSPITLRAELAEAQR